MTKYGVKFMVMSPDWRFNPQVLENLDTYDPRSEGNFVLGSRWYTEQGWHWPGTYTSLLNFLDVEPKGGLSRVGIGSYIRFNDFEILHCKMKDWEPDSFVTKARGDYRVLARQNDEPVDLRRTGYVRPKMIVGTVFLLRPLITFDEEKCKKFYRDADLNIRDATYYTLLAYARRNDTNPQVLVRRYSKIMGEKKAKRVVDSLDVRVRKAKKVACTLSGGSSQLPRYR